SAPSIITRTWPRCTYISSKKLCLCMWSHERIRVCLGCERKRTMHPYSWKTDIPEVSGCWLRSTTEKNSPVRPYGCEDSSDHGCRSGSAFHQCCQKTGA